MESGKEPAGTALGEWGLSRGVHQCHAHHSEPTHLLQSHTAVPQCLPTGSLVTMFFSTNKSSSKQREGGVWPLNREYSSNDF